MANVFPVTTTAAEQHTVADPTVATLARQSLEQRRAASGPEYDIVDEWGQQSFPASDPPPNW